jgi:hypothetical protein
MTDVGRRVEGAVWRWMVDRRVGCARFSFL